MNGRGGNEKFPPSFCWGGWWRRGSEGIRCGGGGLFSPVSYTHLDVYKRQQAEDAVLLGFSQLGWESAWRIGNSLDIQEAAERAGVQLMFDNAQQKQENQIKAIRSFIAYQVDVIAFAPIVEQGWDTVLQEAKDAGIPVLLTDRLIVTDDPSLYVGYRCV